MLILTGQLVVGRVQKYPGIWIKWYHEVGVKGRFYANVSIPVSLGDS